MGCHLIDVVEYYLGPLATAWGRGLIAEPTRRNTQTGASVEATGEDSLVALLRTESGVDVSLTYLPSGPGHDYGRRSVHGRAGSMIVPPDRSEGLVVVHTADGALEGDGLRAALGDHFALDEVTQALLGPEGIGGPAFADRDAGYLGVEIADFVTAVLDGRAPEVDGVGGLRAVAGVYAILESGVLGRAISVDEVLDGSVCAYQAEIDAALGLG
jgi:predicted dehydrogenase